MSNNNLNASVKLSILWIMVLLTTIVRDLHELLRVGHIEDIMATRIPETTMLFYAIVVELPIAMILLSRTLPPDYNRWANSVVAVVVLLGVLSTVPVADLDDLFFAIINGAFLLTILLTARRLSSRKKRRIILLNSPEQKRG